MFRLSPPKSPNTLCVSEGAVTTAVSAVRLLPFVSRVSFVLFIRFLWAVVYLELTVAPIPPARKWPVVCGGPSSAGCPGLHLSEPYGRSKSCVCYWQLQDRCKATVSVLLPLMSSCSFISWPLTPSTNVVLGQPNKYSVGQQALGESPICWVVDFRS
jgi:hypothetical protein